MAMLSVPLKPTAEVDIVQPLKNIILSTYDKMEAQEFQPKLEELARMRKSAVVNTLDRSETSLELLFRYYDQISALEAKLPVAEHNIPFKWKDAFDKGGLFSGRMSLTGNSLAFERACVLFNIGVLLSQIAGEQNFHNDDGLKRSAKLYQQAAGVFLYLKDCVLSCVQKDPTPDLHPDTLTALQTLMLGQAQEVFYIKAQLDGLKEPLMAKISAQVSEFYAEALKLMQRDLVRSSEWDRDWVSRVAGKQGAFHALSQYYQGMVAKGTRDYGEQLARLKHAHELMMEAKKRWESGSNEKTFPYEHELKIIAHEFEMIQKDNNFIYHARIPEVKALTPIGRAALSKPTQLPSRFTPSEQFKDMFESLMPLQVHTAINAHNARFAEAVNREVNTMREQTQLMNTALASMNLPAAVEDTKGNELPDSIKQKSQAVRDAGGVVFLRDKIRALPDNLQRNREILDECTRLLEEELSSDRQLRSQFKERWQRTPSEKLTEPLMLEIAKYRAVLENAGKADSTVREKCQKNENAFDLLSRSEHDLANGLPSSGGGSALGTMKDSGVVRQLRGLLEELDTIKAERQAMEAELKPMQLDMRNEFMRIIKQQPAAPNLDAVSLESTGQRLQPLQRSVRESVQKQEQLMNQVQRAFQQFQQERSSSNTSGGSSRSRDDVLKELATGHDAFFELKSHLDEGNKFYADLTELLLKFQNKIRDFIFARNTEKDDLMKALQSDIVNRKTGDHPKMPSYQPTHEVDSPAKQQQNAGPPPRPPPPRGAGGNDGGGEQHQQQHPGNWQQQPQYNPPYNPTGGPQYQQYPPYPQAGAPPPQQQQQPPPQQYAAYPAYNPTVTGSAFSPYPNYVPSQGAPPPYGPGMQQGQPPLPYGSPPQPYASHQQQQGQAGSWWPFGGK